MSSPRLVGLSTPARAAGAEQFRQDIRIDRTALGRKPAGAEVEAEIAKIARTAPWLGAKAEAFELRRPRLALRVDLAAIEGLALLVVAEDLVRRAHFRETLLRLRLLALVGVVFLGQLAKRGFDFRFARRLGNAKHVIWITHL